MFPSILPHPLRCSKRSSPPPPHSRASSSASAKISFKWSVDSGTDLRGRIQPDERRRSGVSSRTDAR
eukprot:8362129-Pyramimonas_sp.AAC.2